MNPNMMHKDCELIYVIVGSEAGSKVLHIAKQNGITGGVIFRGRGTVKSQLLELLALDDVRKEIVLMATTKGNAPHIFETLNKELKLFKAHHGIAFSVPLMGICSSRFFEHLEHQEAKGDEKTMYKSVTVIVDKGRGEDVVTAATKAGAKGATIVNARGSGIHETSKLFAMEIEPEKELVLIISKDELVETIVDSIHRDFLLDKPGKGILFIQEVVRAIGLTD